MLRCAQNDMLHVPWTRRGLAKNVKVFLLRDALEVYTQPITMDLASIQDIRSAAAGDEGAYGRLVQHFQDDISARMWRFTRDRTAHEELVQEVFVEVYFSLPGYRAEAPFDHWLHTIATRVGYRFWQKQKRQRSAPMVSFDDWDSVAIETM